MKRNLFWWAWQAFTALIVAAAVYTFLTVAIAVAG